MAPDRMLTTRLAIPTANVPYHADVPMGGVTVSVEVNPRCHNCGKLLARYLTTPYALECPRCKALNQVGQPPTLRMTLDTNAP